MDTPAEIEVCTRQDYDRILDELDELWDGRDTRQLHHPFLIYEFGDSAFLIRRGGEIVAYLFGFLSQTEPVGYVHAIACGCRHGDKGTRSGCLLISCSSPASAAVATSRR